jgi:hypothetical protein
MNLVQPGEPSGASALNFLVAFSSQALAAGGALLSGLLSRKLLRGLTEPPARSRPGCPAGSAPG